jgi:holo-[acyl-carrier protein] synthase
VVLGLGVDVVEVDRVASALGRWGDRLVAKLMDPEEASRLPVRGPARALAVALGIAAKESASKALGTGWSRGVRWRDVVVELEPEPRVRLKGRAAAVARRMGSEGRGRTFLERRGDIVVGEFWLLT